MIKNSIPTIYNTIYQLGDVVTKLGTNFKRNVARLLAKRKWTQLDLAEKMNVTKGNISNLLSERFDPQFSTVERVAEVLRVSPLSLISPPPKPPVD